MILIILISQQNPVLFDVGDDVDHEAGRVVGD